MTNLQKIYDSINDIDLIVGAISEKPKGRATVGVTLACIIGKLHIFFFSTFNTCASKMNIYSKFQ